MRESGVPMQMINGRSDLVAGVCWVKKLAKQLKCPLILTGTLQCPYPSPHSTCAPTSITAHIAGACRALFKAHYQQRLLCLMAIPMRWNLKVQARVAV